MTRSVRACHPETNLAAALMWEGDCGTLPVVVDGGKIIGMITDRDIAIELGTRRQIAAETPVSEAMSKEVFACAPDDDIHTALKTMRKDRVRRLPVINDEGSLQGSLSMNAVAIHAEKFDGSLETARHFLPVGNPAPPRPRRPESSTLWIISSGDWQSARSSAR